MDDDACSFVPIDHDYYNDQSATVVSKLQQYKTEATVSNHTFV